MILDIKHNNNRFDRTETLVGYFNDIKKLDTSLTHEDEEVLFHYIKNGNKKDQEWARKYLIESNQRFVVSVARKFASNYDLMDLIDEGNIGLMEAIDAYDPSVRYKGRRIKFITFAVYYIRRAINLYRVNNGSIIRKSNISKTYHLISKARNAFTQENKREPTVDELKDYINEKYNVDIKKSYDLLDVRVSYIDCPVDDDSTENSSDILQFNSVSASANTYEKSVEIEYSKEITKSLLKSLSLREQKIVRMTYGIGYDRELTNDEIAFELGLTTERIRQMKSEIMKKLKTKCESFKYSCI